MIVNSNAALEEGSQPDGEIVARPHGPMPRIGEMMVARGLITEEQLEVALEHQRLTGRLMGEILVEIGAIERLDLVKVLAERKGFPFVDLRGRTIDPALTALVPEDLAMRYNAVPIEQSNGQLVVAMVHPENVFAVDDLRVVTGVPIVPVMAEPNQLADAMSRWYNRSEVVASADDAASEYDEPDLSSVELKAETEEAPIVRLVNALLSQAVRERASDIHIEPMSDRLRIRLRTDGVLHEASSTPLSVLRPLISRIKVLAGIDIATRRVPQDGRFTMRAGQHALDVRVATLPTAHGEAAVLRLLDTVSGPLSLADLGLQGPELERYEQAHRSSQGGIVVSGPTGSGKTSTLYGTLLKLNAPERSIVSVEDPVEYQLDGVKQVQINTKAGVTFPAALRAILRSDPDVVMVGEIRDTETAKIAAEASITGHLVLSTLHTSSAAGVPMRLIDMGVEPYLVASALTCIVGQRLVRKLCEECAVPGAIDDGLLPRLGLTRAEVADANIRQAVGCPSCAHTGYRGRTGLYEVLIVTEEMRRLIVSGAPSIEIERRAIAEGMDTLQMAGVRAVLEGTLSVDEYLRVIA